MLQGCQLGPCLRNSAEQDCLHVWLQPMSTVPLRTLSCLLHRLRTQDPKLIARMLSPASGRRSAVTLPRQPKQRGKDALRKSRHGVQREKGTEGRSTCPGLPVAYRPLPHAPHSIPAHRLVPSQGLTPPPPTPTPIPAPIVQCKDTRHRLGPPKPAHHYPLSGDVKHGGAPRNKGNTVHPPLWQRLTQHMACLIAWINCSHRQSLTWDSAIARRHGLSSAPRVQAPYWNVAADCKGAAANHSKHVEVLMCWEPPGPREGDALPTGVVQLLLTPASKHMCPDQLHSQGPLGTPPGPEYIFPQPSLRCAELERTRTSRPALPQGALTHVSMRLRSAASCYACAAHRSSRVFRCCQHFAEHLEPNHMYAEGTMPKPSEEPEPREGEPKARASKQPRSRFRAHSRHQLKKRAPTSSAGRMRKPGDGRAMESKHPPAARDRSTSASTRMKTRLTPSMGDLPRRRTPVAPARIAKLAQPPPLR